jgi:hypothetical protein
LVLPTVCLAFFGLVTPVHGGPVWSAAGDFSATSNPNGVWSYGSSSSLGGAFALDAIRQNVGGIDFWQGPDSFGGFNDPFIGHNATSSPLSFGTGLYNPGQMGVHPGAQGEDAVVRWTAPQDGAYQIAVTFSGQDFAAGTTTDVHVLDDNVSLFDGLVNGFGDTASFTGTRVLRAGETIDFAVGVGPDGSLLFDTTGLDATITAITVVPEPDSLLLFTLGVFGLGYVGRRKAAGALC